ncbi:methylmalonate-semialdehyde dehydrogenase [acylating], mitochondrial isoform X2 [Daucus carota subsp. sativus]|uniref:methylmalonate-semialdehyde dehydrogenase [acylating], mitochondrial isoform X2 n=1 Tax=Daucus carota subsp. sativus TaxID=79200 RepID=UPI0030830063
MDSNCSELSEIARMLPPDPGTFVDREELIHYVGKIGVSQGYVVTIKQSKKDKVVMLGCDRGGVHRSRRKHDGETSGECSRNRKSSSRLTNCPFELMGKKEDGVWVLTIKNGSHNHEALKDITEHPSASRFTEKEVMQIKEMTESGLKPRQILKRLRQSNPKLLSTPKHVYNVKAKLRQGNLTVKTLKTLSHEKPTEGNLQSSTSNAEPSWRRSYPSRVPNFIGGKFVESQSLTSIDVINPATQEVVFQVPVTTNEEFKAAVFASKRAFLSWRDTPLLARQRVMFRFRELIQRNIEKIALSITTEQGKTLKDARHDVVCGLEAVEDACATSLPMGKYLPNVLDGTDTYIIREPLGVCAGICPLNFPALVPLWMFPIAVTCGNTFILKPSERDTAACLTLAELAMEAGLPNGVLNVIHGANDIINAILDNDEIKAVSFVGPDTAGMYVNARALANGKRVQTNAGARNHAVVMPDASMDATLDALVGSGFSAAGQRCTAINIIIFVGGSKSWEDKLVSRAKALKVSAGIEPDVDIGPVISKQAKENICKLVQSGVDSGARLILDGRQITVPNYELGNFIGPTILCDVTNSMGCYKEEFIGPVLLCMQADSLDEAISIVNRNKYGIGASIFTTSGIAARKFQDEVEAGQVGINVPVPAPLQFFSLTGSKASISADLNFYGVHFYTQIKTVTQQWSNLDYSDATSSIPPLSNVPGSSDIADIYSQGLQSNDYQGIDEMQSNDYENMDGIQLNDLQCRDGMQSNDLGSMDRVSLDLQRNVFRSNDADAPTLQPNYPQSSNRVSMPLQYEDFQSRSGVSLTLHSNDFSSTDEEGQPMSKSHAI